MQSIGCFRNCEALDLGGTNISDDGVRHLTGMESLQYLFLWHTPITNSAVSLIKNLSQLRMLSVANTSISELGIEELNASLENCLLCLEDGRYRFGCLRDSEALHSFLES